MNVVEQSSRFLTQWGLVPSFTTSDLGEAGNIEQRTRGGGGERRLLHKENFSTYKRRIPTALQGLCSGVNKLEEFSLFCQNIVSCLAKRILGNVKGECRRVTKLEEFSFFY